MLELRHILTMLSVASLLAGCPSQTVPTSPSGQATGSTTAEESSTGTMTTTGQSETSAVTPMDTALDSSTDHGGGFIPAPDGGDDLSCDHYAQDCPAGQKCTPWANDGGSNWNDHRCVPIVDDPRQPGEPCTVQDSATSGFDDCELGSMCWDVDPREKTGTCVSMCAGTDQEPFCDDPQTYCVIASRGVITLCLSFCSPLTQNCPADQGCYSVDDSWMCFPDDSGRSGAYGDPCKFLSACDPGLVCLAPGATPDCTSAVGCCSDICDLSDPAGDAQCMGASDGQTCQAWYREGSAPPGQENIGVCAL